MREPPKYCIVGSGKMARHFSHYLGLLQIGFTILERSDITRSVMEKHLLEDDKILLLIQDKSLQSFINMYHLAHHPKIVHFSGSMVIDGCYSAHPLMTFGDLLYSIETYEKIPFVIEGEGPSFNQLLPGLPNVNFKIPKEKKPFYHSLCVMAGNFSVILWQKYFQEMEMLGISMQDARVFMKCIFENVSNNPDSALTGPLVRGDEETIALNLAALENDSFYEVYQAFVRAHQLECLRNIS